MDLFTFTSIANNMLFGAVNSTKASLLPGKSFNEPEYLSAIVTRFPLLMNGTWTGVKFGGCFVHKSPLVAFKKGGSCESGDLLVLCRNRVDGVERYNACLFQLKRTFGKIRIKPDNLIQYELYTNWPEFSIGRIFQKSNSFDINPKTVTPGAQYMLIDDGVDPYYWHCDCVGQPCVFTHSIPMPEMRVRSDLSFGRFIWDFINWQNGRPIAPKDNCANDEWSRFIWDLISRTQRTFIQDINVGIKKTDRFSKQQGDFFSLITTSDSITHLPEAYLKSLTEQDSGLHSNDVEDNGGGVSILFIDLNFDSER